MHGPTDNRPLSGAADLLGALRQCMNVDPADTQLNERRRQIGRAAIEAATRVRSDEDADDAYRAIAQNIRSQLAGETP